MDPYERLLDLTVFLLTVSYQLIMPILPIYIHDILGASKQEVGIIISLAAVASAFSRIPSSLWTMRRNILKILIFGVSLNTVALLGYTLSLNPWMLAFFRILHGISFALNYTLTLSLASLIVRPDKAQRAIASYTASIAMGLWIGPALGVILSSFLDSRMLIFSAAMMSSTAILSCSFFLRMKPELWESIYYSKVKISLMIKSLLKRPIILPTFFYLLYSTVVGSLLAYGPLRAKIDFKITDQAIILFFTIYFLIVYLLRTILSKSAHLLLDVNLLYLALGSCAFGILLVGLSPTIEMFVAGIYLVAIAHGLTFPLIALMIVHIIPPNLRIIGNAIYLTSWDIGNLLGPLVVASILYVTSLSIALAIISLFAITALLLTSKITRIIG